jgi:hypothetical protein
MKKLIIYFGLLLVAGVFLNSCYKDVYSPDIEYAPQAVSFNNDLAPLFSSRCTDVGCHVTGGHVPYMDDVTKSFKNIVSGGYVNTSFPKDSKFYQLVYGEMSQYTSKDEKLKVYDWIRNGAKNN